MRADGDLVPTAVLGPAFVQLDCVLLPNVFPKAVFQPGGLVCGFSEALGQRSDLHTLVNYFSAQFLHLSVGRGHDLFCKGDFLLPKDEGLLAHALRQGGSFLIVVLGVVLQTGATLVTRFEHDLRAVEVSIQLLLSLLLELALNAAEVSERIWDVLESLGGLSLALIDLVI